MQAVTACVACPPTGTVHNSERQTSAKSAAHGTACANCPPADSVTAQCTTVACCTQSVQVTNQPRSATTAVQHRVVANAVYHLHQTTPQSTTTFSTSSSQPSTNSDASLRCYHLTSRLVLVHCLPLTRSRRRRHDRHTSSCVASSRSAALATRFSRPLCCTRRHHSTSCAARSRHSCRHHTIRRHRSSPALPSERTSAFTRKPLRHFLSADHHRSRGHTSSRRARPSPSAPALLLSPSLSFTLSTASAREGGCHCSQRRTQHTLCA